MTFLLLQYVQPFVDQFPPDQKQAAALQEAGKAQNPVFPCFTTSFFGGDVFSVREWGSYCASEETRLDFH